MRIVTTQDELLYEILQELKKMNAVTITPVKEEKVEAAKKALLEEEKPKKQTSRKATKK